MRILMTTISLILSNIFMIVNGNKIKLEPLAFLTTTYRINNGVSKSKPQRNTLFASNDKQQPQFENVSTKNSIITKIPNQTSYLDAIHISQSYPITLVMKLFSSVPKREYAIHDVTISFRPFPSSSLISGYDNTQLKCSDHAFILLVGRSGSGKSTLLRLLSGMESPKAGQVFIQGKSIYNNEKDDDVLYNQNNMNSKVRMDSIQPKPVIIDSKPEVNVSSSKCILTCIQEKGYQIYNKHSDNNKNQHMTDDNTSINEIIQTVIPYLAYDFGTILGFTPDELNTVTPSQLTPSNLYLYGIACACMESILSSKIFHHHSIPNESTSLLQNIMSIGIPYPILLIDELLDYEHVDISKRVARGLSRLVDYGAIVVVSTHRPNHYVDVKGRRVITLSSGKTLFDEIIP